MMGDSDYCKMLRSSDFDTRKLGFDMMTEGRDEKYTALKYVVSIIMNESPSYEWNNEILGDIEVARFLSWLGDSDYSLAHGKLKPFLLNPQYIDKNGN